MGTSFLTGTFTRSVDEKHRIAIPKPLRDALGHPDQTVLYAAPGTDGSLALYTEEGFSHLADRLSAASPAAYDVRSFSRLFYAQAQRVEMDRQGRIRIPPELCHLVSLEHGVVLIGVRDHMELWEQPRWETYLAEQQPQYDDIAEKALRPQ